MFGSTNPFGQSSSSPFGSQSIFGQTSNINPFAPKPFGATSPFGSQTTGGSIFGGGTSTGVFGATQSSSPLASTPTFGASSTTPTFGSSAPGFGASTTPSFGSSVFGQKPAFGGFGSTPTQTSPFGSTFQPTQPAFGSNLFGSSSTFGAPSQPAFGATSTPAFGGASTPAFGSTSTPAFGSTSTPAYGSTSTPTFGSTSTPAFGSTGSAFGVSSAPAFGSGGAFGSSSTPVFGSSTPPSFGASTAPAFGAASTPSFSFGTSPAFGQSAPAFSSTQFGTTQSAFGAQTSPFGAQATTPTFGNSAFGQSSFGSQRGGSRVAPYTPTTELDGGTSAQSAGKLESISAMQVYKDKSHEELRWEDYQLGDKGGPNPASQSAGGVGFGATVPQSNPFGPSPSFAPSSSNPFPSTTTSNPFTPKVSAFGSSSTPAFGSSSTPAFGTSTTNIFGSSSSSTPPLFGSSTPAFGASSSQSIFGGSGSAFGSTSSIFGSSAAGGTTAAFGSSPNFGNTQPAGLFQSTVPSLGQTNSAFGQTGSIFGQTPPPAFGQSNPNPFGAASTGFGGNLFSSNSSLIPSSNQPGFGSTALSLSTPFQSQPAQTPGVFSFPNFGQAQAASSGLGGISSGFGQGTFGQSPSNNGVNVQPTPVANPFGTLPAMPHISIGRSGSTPSVQYGISSMPATEKSAPIRVSSLLTPRHLSQRRIRLPARKYHPKNDGPKLPFYSDDEEAPSTPKADALYIPRENPRALVINPTEKWPPRVSIIEKSSLLKDTYIPVHENGKLSGEGSIPTSNDFIRHNKDRGPAENGPVGKANGDSYMITLTGHRAGEAAIVYEHGADIEALMPKLRHAEYYTEPRIQELAAKERAVPGCCQRVKDFVVGRHGFGSIKFIGETDVRRLDLESLVQFNNREVIVYMDESKKPPVGQGLNKPAVVTLLNIKCIDKKTKKQYTEGPRVDKYKEMLMKKTLDQGAEFVSYQPLEGEWKFKVKHFSRYTLFLDHHHTCFL